MPTILIFVRHGESEGNRSDSFNGHVNVPLADFGKRQAQKTAELLDRYKIDAVYSSDLARAYETAKFTADRQGLTVVISKNLREINGGDFEGVKYSEIEARFPNEYHDWRNNMGNCRCPNGESVRELATRVNQEVTAIAEKHKGQTVLIATHGTPMRAMSTVWFKKDITDIRDYDWVKNASVTVVNYDDLKNPKVELYDEHDHLNGLLTELPAYI